jgi:hypothetical protein
MTDLSIVADKNTADLSIVADQNWIASKKTGFDTSERWSFPARVAFISAATLMSWGIVFAIGYGIGRLI